MKKTGRRIRTQWDENTPINLTPKGDAEIRMLYMLAMAIKTEVIYEMPQSLIDGFEVPLFRKMLNECATVEEQIDVVLVATSFFPDFSADMGETADECRTLAAKVAKYLVHGELPERVKP